VPQFKRLQPAKPWASRLPGCAAVLSTAAWLLLCNPLTAQEPIGILQGGEVDLHGAVSMVGGRTQVLSGTVVELRGGDARLLLNRGGYVRLCGPLRATFLAGGGGALLISVDRGSVELRFAAHAADSFVTPDYEVVVSVPQGEIGVVSASIAIDQNGHMCIANRGSLLRITDRWAGQDYTVPDSARLLFVPERIPVPSISECGCTPPPPAPLIEANAESGATTRSPQAVTTLRYPDVPQPPAPSRTAPPPPRPAVANRVAPPPSRPTAAPVPKTKAPPAKGPAVKTKAGPAPQKRRNIISRLFHKLFG
jgi:hypothetical protein